MATTDTDTILGSPSQASAAAGTPHVWRRPWHRLRTAGWLAFGAVRRFVTRPARLFHGKAEADRTRDQVAAQRLNARHFRGL